MRKLIAAVFLMFCFLMVSVYGQRTGFQEEEFTKRRAVLMEQVKEGMILLFADAFPHPGVRFRQDNDFYYFTGIEDKNGILLMRPETGESLLFLPRKTLREEMVEGKNLLGDTDAQKKINLDAVHPITYFNEYLARNMKKVTRTFYIRLSGKDTVDMSRREDILFQARKARNPYNDQISLDQYRVKTLRDRFPSFDIKDISSEIDAMRVIKSPREIEILRRNGKISAEGVKAAMLATRPGVYEYELEAAAMYVVSKNGALGAAYPPIVGSGPNSCIWHYEKSERRMEAGDIVLMDFGANLDYLSMDITRTWPVSGKFTPDQREAYQAVLEVQKACIESYRPGVTIEDVREYVAKVLKKRKIDTRGLKGTIHHYIGMATHDVGLHGVPLKEGMVFTIEPGLYYPEKELGIRIEDTVLITRDGCEVLTKDVPKEIDEIEKFMAKRK